MVSGVGPLLYIISQALVDALPFLPPMTLNSELPLAMLDGHTRAMLVCTLVPPVVLRSPLPAVSDSPWALLLTSFVRARHLFYSILFSCIRDRGCGLLRLRQIITNGGFF